MTGAFDNIHPGLTCESAYRILRSDANDLTCQSDFYMATSHLINFPGPETESSLLEFLKRPASEKSIAHAQRKAVEVIARLGIRKAQAQIGDCLDSDDVYLVENAAWALGQLDCQDHHLHDKMIRLLSDAPPNSRVLIQALAKLEVRSAVPVLLKLCDDPRPSVRGAAIAAVARLQGLSGDLGILGEHLYLKNQMDRQSAVQDIIDSGAVELLSDVIEAPISPAFKIRAVRNLLDLENTTNSKYDAVSMIDRLLLDESDQIVVLHRYEDELAPELLIQGLFHPDFSMCYLAMQTLEKHNVEKLAPLLLEKWQSDAYNDYGAHYFFIQLFGRLKGWSESALQSIKDILEEAMLDSRPQFRKSVPISILSFARTFPELFSDRLDDRLISGNKANSWQLKYAVLLSLEKYCRQDEQRKYLSYVENLAENDGDSFVRLKAESLQRNIISLG